MLRNRMMKTKAFIIILILFLTSCSLNSKEFKAKIYKVSDGDTVWVKRFSGKKIKLRLIGIDTPEKFDSRKLKKDCAKCGVKIKKMKYLGRLASKYAKSLLHKGDIVTVVAHGKGYYKRTLAEVILPDNENFNKKIVRNGYACAYRNKYPYEELEQEAKREKRGLWSEYYDIMNCLCK